MERYGYIHSSHAVADQGILLQAGAVRCQPLSCWNRGGGGGGGLTYHLGNCLQKT